MTLLETLILVLIVGGLLFVAGTFLIGLKGRGGMTPRTACAANMGGFARACVIYSEDNRGLLPAADNDPSQRDGPPWVQSASFVGVNRTLPDRVTDPADPIHNLQNNGSNTRGWFKLLRGGRRAFMQSKSLICPVAEAKKLGHKKEGAQLTYEADGEQRSYYDFDGTIRTANDSEMIEFSYSFHVTLRTDFGTADKPDIRGPLLVNTMDPGLAIAADRNPYSNDVRMVGGNAVYEWNPGKLGMVIPPNGAKFTLPNLKTKAANSRNHGCEGQNVAFLDGHAKWFNNPLAGVDGDFIWGTVDPTSGYAPTEPARGLDYGRMRPYAGPEPQPTWTTDSLLMP